MSAADTPSRLGAFVWHGKTRLQRFWEKVAKAGPEDCWLWTGSFRTSGHGQSNDWRNTLKPAGSGHPPVNAHVLSWAIAHDRWPLDGEVVRHSCDNPACVNPGHLLIGSRIDLARSTREKGTNPAWESADEDRRAVDAEMALITPQRLEILRALMRVPQPTVGEIARELGVSRQAIEQSLERMERRGLVRRQSWVVLNPERFLAG